MNWEREAASRLPGLLEGWLRTPVEVVDVESATAGRRVDLEMRAGGHRFVVEVKGSDDIAILERAAATVGRCAHAVDVGVVAVPYMGPKAREWAAQHGISWVDLSGNADIRGDGLVVVVSGARNRYASPGRPSNPFTARYSRVSRALLAHPDRWWKQREIAEEVGLPAGTVSKVVHRLDALDLLVRNDQDALRSRDPSLLLDSWSQRYDFADHAVRRFHMVARSGEEALRILAERLDGLGHVFAATGLSAAWLYTAHADFRLNSFYVDRLPIDPGAIGLRPVDRGENVWLVVPNDDGVFYGRAEPGTWCAHPAQVYLDLAFHPERAAEAAAELRARSLAWRR